MRKIPENAALLVLDMQRDFMPGGALAIAQADELLPAIEHYQANFENARAPVFFSRDCHPPDHCSFKSQGGRWPAHCVAGTAGVEFARGMRIGESAVVISKATERGHEAYSAFEGTALARLLRERQVRELWVCGVATEYCVRATVLDALKVGFGVTVLIDAVRAVDLVAGDGERALGEMTAAGAHVHSWAQPHGHVIPAKLRS